MLLQPHEHVEHTRRDLWFYLTQELEGLLDFYSATSCFQGLFVTLSYSIYIFIISFDNHFYHIHFMLREIVLLKMIVDQCIDCVVGVMFLKFRSNWEPFSRFVNKYSCRIVGVGMLYSLFYIKFYPYRKIQSLSIYLYIYCIILFYIDMICHILYINSLLYSSKQSQYKHLDSMICHIVLM